MKTLVALFAILLASEAIQVSGPGGKIYEDVKKITVETGRTEEAKEKSDIFDINRDLNGLIDGDILQSKTTMNTNTDLEYFWPSTKIPFVYSRLTLSLEAIGSIELARREYKLRTCLDFVERTDEDNYIFFQSLNGCYSSLGMVGGAQTISIGSGCERIGTVCHEMMHAIGIWHEQSRADRDDYVQIMWEIITPGRENNFRKYDWEVSDARRVPYDYNSVMHYSDSGFSTTGDPTIVTRDPAFQDVIGQRYAFSRGDTEKINRMYECSDTLLFSYNCNYDDESECGYVNDFDSDNVDWLRYDVGDKSVNVSPNVPSMDATLGITGKGTYMVLDTSGKTEGMLGELRSMRFVSRSEEQCLQFSYYIDRNEASTAALGVHVGTLDGVKGDVIDEGDAIVTLESNTNRNWFVQRMTIKGPSAYKIIFKGKTGAYIEDVLAIDDVSVQDKPCEDAYFQVQDYSTVLEDYERGDFFLSPVMTTTQGYNFRLKIYPNGATSSADGFMSVYFGLVQGPNDDDLPWPFCNKFVRLMIADRNEDPLYAFNKYSEYLTSESAGGPMWNKPTGSESAGYYGYSNYFRISDLTGTHHYNKHDSVLFSVLTQDMNWVDGEECSGNFTKSVNKVAPISKQGKSNRGTNAGVDYMDGNEYHNENKDYNEHRGDNHHDHDGGNHHDHDHENDHDDDHHDHDGNHHDHDHENDHDDDHHDHDGNHHGHDHHGHDHPDNDHDDCHDDDDHDEAMVPVGAAVGIALGCSTFVLMVMSGVLCCVIKSYKRNVKCVENNIAMHTNTQLPPAYPNDPVKFDPLPLPKV